MTSIFKSPKAMVLSVAPKATCVRDWLRGGYRIDFNQTVNDFDGNPITSMKTHSLNPTDAWSDAVLALRLDGFNNARP